MKIGYSCWGFLGNGVVDTPDGGRSHRKTLLSELLTQGVRLVMLQNNRDLEEAGQNIEMEGLSFSHDFPELDALFVEYRWKIPGRNCEVDRSSDAYTPDLDRQRELLEYYGQQKIPILVWDKDQKFSDEEIDNGWHLFEPALKPNRGRKSLLFPCDPVLTQRAYAALSDYDTRHRSYDLSYVGNQYERDGSVVEFLELPASLLENEVRVYGNWTKYPEQANKNCARFPHLKFKDRIRYDKVKNVYANSLATVLIAPERYYRSGQYTQRLFESLWELCLPFVPSKYAEKEKVVIPELVIANGKELVQRIAEFRWMNAGDIRHLLQTQLELLDIFAVKRQVQTIIDTIKSHEQ